jgi:glycosyl transferase family 25
MPIRTGISVISLAADSDRRGAFLRNAAMADVEWRFFDACTGLAPGLTYDPAESDVAWGRRLTQGELGCYASHFSLWQNLLASDLDQLIILEDDLLVDWGFIRLMLDVDFSAQGINYLRLFSRVPCPSRHIRWRYLDDSRALIRFVDYALGTQAYLITRNGAATLSLHCQRVRRAIDHEMDRFWDHGVPNLAVYPYPVVEISAPSRIGGSRFETSLIPPALRQRRLAARALEKVRRTMARVSPNPRLIL